MADEWRVSWTGIEVFQKPELYQINANNVEVLTDAYTSKVNINANSVEVLHDGTWVNQTHRVSWVGKEVFLSSTPPARISWVGKEVFLQYTVAGGDDSSIAVFW